MAVIQPAPSGPRPRRSAATDTWATSSNPKTTSTAVMSTSRATAPGVPRSASAPSRSICGAERGSSVLTPSGAWSPEIASTQTAAAATASAARTNARAGSARTTSAPTAGPAIQVSWITPPSAAVAPASSLPGASVGRTASAAGRNGVVSTASSAAKTTITAGDAPAAAADPKRRSTAARPAHDPHSTRRRSTRSATTPLIGASRTAGRKRSATATPTQPVEPVRS